MGTQCSGTAKVYFPSTLVQFTDDQKEQHPREYGGAVGLWVVVEGVRYEHTLIDCLAIQFGV